MEERRNYSIRKNRYKYSCMSGFEIEGDNKLKCVPDEYSHYVILGQIDGIEQDANWGRLNFSCNFEEDVLYNVYIFATNFEDFNRKGVLMSIDEFLLGDEDINTKKEFFKVAEGKKYVNTNDILLYDVKGRYLHVMIEVTGMGEGYLERLNINSQGDFYIKSFPEVYYEYGSFLHRYMSVFSSMFVDLQEKIENIDEIFDLDKAPVSLLTLFGKWMGIDVSGNFLSRDKLKALVKEAYSLNRMKGTKRALERLTEIILEEKTVILEKSQLQEEAKDKESFEALYGKGNYDVTILIKTFVPENQKSQLMFLIKQFVPIRCNLNIRFLDDCNGLDDHMYMDMNTQISDEIHGELDARQVMDGTILLNE